MGLSDLILGKSEHGGKPPRHLGKEGAVLKSSRRVFIVFFLGGSIWIFLSYIFSVPPVISVIIAIIILLMYIAVARLFVEKGYHELLGDSAYCLGFLFTFVSLVATIIFFKATDIQSVLGGFGIALSTTIVGFLGHVWYSQFLITVEAEQETAKLELHSTVKEFGGELQNCIKTLSDTHKLTLKDFSRAIKHITTDIQEIDKHTADSIDNASHVAAESIRASAEENLSSMQLYTKKMTDQMANIFNKINNQIESFEIPSELLSSKIQETVEEVNDRLKHTSKLIQKETQLTLQSISDLANNVAEKTSMISESLVSQTSSFEEYNELFSEKLKELLSDVTLKLRETSKSVLQESQSTLLVIDDLAKDLSEQTRRALEKFSNQVENFEIPTDLFSIKIQEMFGSINEIVEPLKAAVGETTAIINDQNVNMQGFTELVRQANSDLKDLNEGMVIISDYSTLVSESDRALRSLKSSFESLSESLNLYRTSFQEGLETTSAISKDIGNDYNQTKDQIRVIKEAMEGIFAKLSEALRIAKDWITKQE